MIQDAIKNIKGLHVKEILEKKDILFLKREEFKYIIPIDFLNEILNDLSVDFYHSHFDDGFIYKYHNVYFDTKDYKFFNLHRQGKYNRIKLRVRKYQNGIINKYMECKRKVRGMKIKKERIKLLEDYSDNKLLSQDFIKEDLKKYNLKPQDLQKKTEISYSRLNLVSNCFKTRITFDFDIFAKDFNSDIALSIIPKYIIMEVKSEKFPKDIDRLLRRKYNIREVSISKYCVALCALNKDLKSNKWKNILKKHF